MNDFARRDISWVEYNAYFAQANHSIVSVGLTVANHGSFTVTESAVGEP